MMALQQSTGETIFLMGGVMKRNSVCIAAVVIYLVCLTAMTYALPTPDRVPVDMVFDTIPAIQVPFIENRGQINKSDVSYYARIRGGALFVKNTGEITYNLSLGEKKGLAFKEIVSEKKNKPSGVSPSPSLINFFKGKDPGSWKTKIPSYEKIDLGEVYNKINLMLKAYDNNVEKIFTVLPGGKPEDINITVKGITGLRIHENGELELIAGLGSVRFTTPIAYQIKNGEKQFVKAAYTIARGTGYGFTIGSYDTKSPLIIDPLLASTLIGAGEIDFSWSVALDGDANVFVTSNTTSMDFPTTLGAYDETYNGGVSDIYVAKFDSGLSSLLACTFLGGEAHDTAYRIIVDDIGNVFLTGLTDSSDFPITPGAYTPPSRGGEEAYVAIFDNALSNLLACSVIGGSNSDSGYDILIDENENVIITGYTASADYPSTIGAYDESHNGDKDVMIAKFDKYLTSLLASTFIGGSGWDVCTGITFDGDGNILMTGAAKDDFPTTPGAWNRTYAGGGDGFVARLDKTFSTLMASTYIGGSANEYGYTVKVNESGEIYMAGELWSSDYPTTPGAYDTTFNGGVMDVMLSKFDSTLSTLLASTYLGGNGQDWHHHNMLIDAEGNVYVTGLTESTDFPTTPDAEKPSRGPHFTIFISKFDSTLSSLSYSTYFGGDNMGNGSLDMVFDPDYNIYITGWTTSADFPTTSGAYDESHNGKMDVFVSKLCIYGTPTNVDCDSIPDDEDNCPDHYNPDQLDSYPPEGGNGCGDSCECHADCDSDQKVNIADLVIMKTEFMQTPVNADCNYDNKVDIADLVMMKNEFMRSDCPVCP